MKTLFITTGTNDASIETKASTERGYIIVAKKLCGDCISCGMQRLKIIVRDKNGEIVYESVNDVIA